MEIKISKLRLKNFKGIKELEINFNCKNTNIYGANATGKTTIFDAFKWLFFDKDSTDRQKFNIKTLDSNNQPIHFLDHEVEAILVIDGVDMTFKKMYKEKWVKKRGEVEQEFAGHEVSYWIDKVPVKKKDYDEKINTLIPESLFKLITDPLYFNTQMETEEKRKLLLEISKADISDEKILASNDKFSIIKENLSGRTVDDYKKVLQAKIKDLNKEKETIPVRIDEVTSTLVTEHDIDYEQIEHEKEMLSEQLQQIETEMIDVQAKAQENMKIADQLATVKKELENFKLAKEVEYSKKYIFGLVNLNNQKRTIENTLQLERDEENNLQLKIKQCQERKNELYKEWDEVSKLKLEIESNSFICPTCKREYDSNKKDEIKYELENNFSEHKKDKQNDINKEGQTINLKIDEYSQKLKEVQQNISDLDSKLNELNNQIAELEMNKESDNSFDITSLPEYTNKLKEIEELEEKVSNLTNRDISYLQNEKAEKNEQINKLNKILNEKEMQEKAKQRIKKLTDDEKHFANLIQELEKQLYAVEEFTKTKIRLSEEAINSKFELVNFRLFESQINGGMKECCDTLVNGVPYADVNNAHKILAGLDIIKTLIIFYDKSAPIFIDNRESINEIDNIDAQVINLIVTNTDSKLRIETNN